MPIILLRWLNINVFWTYAEPNYDIGDYDKSTDSLRYVLSRRNRINRFSGSNVKRTEEFLCQWQETAINGRGFIKREWGGTEQRRIGQIGLSFMGVK